VICNNNLCFKQFYGGGYLRITCDSSCSMGYIYLLDTGLYNNTNSDSVKKIVDSDKCKVERKYSLDIRKEFETLKFNKLTYNAALKKGDIEEEYLNDKDNLGYIKGIELTLSGDKFIQLIEDNAFTLYESFWGDEECFMITFEVAEKVFSRDNYVFQMTDYNDSFVICNINPQNNVCMIRGIIFLQSCVVYNSNYFKNADFVLR
ncbi:hypothetical protein, partial [Petrocella sp. FN5]|uniref:hypothetical protein n=1 Tax=Petrocella sp. FN5 TaxID=3032002 RepID=UPI0023DA0464